MLKISLQICLLVLFSSSNKSSSLRIARQAASIDDAQREDTCDAQLDGVYRRVASIVIHPNLQGYWVSNSCEIRPGPEYIVRKYHFINDTYFRATQFYYLDSSCTSPFYGLEASGVVKLDKNRVNSGMLPWEQNNYELFMSPLLYQVTVLPYTSEAAVYLQSRVSSVCRYRFGRNREVWRADGVPRDILVYVEYKKSVLMDFDCTEKLGFNLNEFLLLRIEESVESSASGDATAAAAASARKRRQLHLGEIATNMKQRRRHRPSGFQPPLEDANNDPCPGCYPVLHASLKTPPILLLQTLLPDYPTGEWVSSVCESRPRNTYVTRRLVFDNDAEQQWTGTYNNFHDPLCKRPFFSFTATGRVISRDIDEHNPDARQFDFLITGLSITPRDQRSLNQMNTYIGYGCGRTSWRINRTQDVTNTNGCDHLRLHVPTKSEQVMMMSLRDGQTWLYVGGISNTLEQMRKAKRPTSFQPPLVRCADSPSQRQQLMRQKQQQQQLQRQTFGYNWNKQLSANGREGISATGRTEPGALVLLIVLFLSALIHQSTF
ncbi:hypothetical protein BOX15_Mlig022720g1 [Macrostomum lignano]|uniref:APCDD1 domain-containing protein n=1 Tax=Macrostomum lignano TaxID=282301 RepID=A0A267FGB7_9PLAT|nr:hypothetical protein BOX15_Mlig022720g1 [Macrostomum lignano]